MEWFVVPILFTVLWLLHKKVDAMLAILSVLVNTSDVDEEILNKAFNKVGLEIKKDKEE